MKSVFVWMMVMFMVLSPNVYADVKYSVDGTPTEYTVGWGDSKSVSFNVNCLNSFYECNCYDRLDSGLWSSIYMINPSQRVPSHSYLLSVPSSGKGQITHTINFKCNEYWDHTYVNKSITIILNYPTDAEWQEYQADQTAKSAASSEINTAQNRINDAQVLINSAKSKINEAGGVGADITQANSHLSSANTALNNAQTDLSTAQTSYNSEEYDTAKSNAEQAQTYANNAKSSANQAKSSAEQAMQQVIRQKTESNNKISGAGSAIDNAKKTIKEAEGLINNATVIGMDTTQSEGDVATARSKLQSAEDYYKEATTAFDAENYDLAKQKASTAESYAGDADSKASSSYNSLWVIYSKKRVAAGAITSADTEVSQMNEINTKMTYVLRNMKTYGVDISETQTVAEECKSSTDSAEDLLSQSKNRMSSGYTDDAVNFAVQARDKAATSHNRLDTIVLNLKFGIQDALEAGYNQKLANLEEAKGAVQSASETYGADEELVIKAQENAANAESILKEAKSKMDLIDGSDSLSDMLTNAKSAFEALEKTQEEADNAKENADNAKMALYQSVAAGAAGIAALGGGFLYWKRKKKNKVDDIPEKKEEMKKSEKKHEKRKEVKKHKTKHKEEKKKKDKGIFCGHCGAKVQKDQKFCGKCGKKVR